MSHSLSGHGLSKSPSAAYVLLSQESAPACMVVCNAAKGLVWSARRKLHSMVHTCGPFQPQNEPVIAMNSASGTDYHNSSESRMQTVPCEVKGPHLPRCSCPHKTSPPCTVTTRTGLLKTSGIIPPSRMGPYRAIQASARIWR